MLITIATFLGVIGAVTTLAVSESMDLMGDQEFIIDYKQFVHDVRVKDTSQTTHTALQRLSQHCIPINTVGRGEP